MKEMPRQEMLERQLPLILLQKEPLTDYWKPPQGRFFACAEGRLLILAPWTLDEETHYGRFHTLNELAHDVCIATDTRVMFKVGSKNSHRNIEDK